MENKKNRLSVICIAFLLVFTIFSSQNIVAAQSLISRSFTRNTPFTEIKNAIENASDNDVFTFEDGTYLFTDSIKISAKNITIQGESRDGTNFTVDTTGYRHFTIGSTSDQTTFEDINMMGLGSNQSSYVNGGIEAHSELILNDIRISDSSGGGDKNGGAIQSDSDVTMTNCILFNNYAYLSGGGLFTSGNAELNNCTMEHNIARLGNGGGIYTGQNLVLNGGSVVDNTAWNMFTDGGGGAYAGNSINANNAVFAKNTTVANGGGLYTKSLSIKGGSVHDNTAIGNNGGGIYVTGALELDDYHGIYGNTAGTYGGGIYGESTISLKDSTIHDNAAYYGGGVYSAGVLSVDSSTLNNNEAAGNGGGIDSVSTATLVNSTLYGNTAKNGGGIYAEKDAELTDCTVTMNTGDPGGVFAGGDLDLLGNIISGNGDSKDVSGIDATKPASPSYNLIGLPDGITLADIFTSSNPELADNGGSTDTVMIGDDSYAQNVLPSGSGYPSTDQRGVQRSKSGEADAGSVEINSEITITSSAGPGGQIDPEGSVNANIGDSVTFSFIPSEGYVVSKVLVDDESVDFSHNEYRFDDVKSDHTIHVDFELSSSDNGGNDDGGDNNGTDNNNNGGYNGTDNNNNSDNSGVGSGNGTSDSDVTSGVQSQVKGDSAQTADLFNIALLSAAAIMAVLLIITITWVRRSGRRG